METKGHATNNEATDAWDKSLKCWRTSSSGPQCLQVETNDEVHLFPYGYFQHAKFFKEMEKDVIQIQFQDRIILAKGTGLKTLCDALGKFTVELIKACPKKYAAIAKSEGTIEDIQIKQRGQENNADED
jgi:hypothetical protein